MAHTEKHLKDEKEPLQDDKKLPKKQHKTKQSLDKKMKQLMDEKQQLMDERKQPLDEKKQLQEEKKQQLLKEKAFLPLGQKKGYADLQELNFELPLTLKKNEEFPPSNGGSVLFQRPKLVKRMVDIFTTKRTDRVKYENFYFRHSAGTGKAVLLKLFGKELQRRGFVVFMLTAPELVNYGLDYFKTFVEKLAHDGKHVALLVDEADKNVNSGHWDYLLKKAHENLLVVGTGTAELDYVTPQFLNKFPSAYNDVIVGPLTKEDMPEVLRHFVKKGDEDAALKKTALNDLLLATGGQVYPFVAIAHHLLDPERSEKLGDLSAYMASKEFQNSEAYSRVRDRCYNLSSSTKVGVLDRLLLEKPRSYEDTVNIMKSGLVIGTREFVSPLLVREIHRQLVKESPPPPLVPIQLNLTEKKFKTFPPVVEQIIAAGLANMQAADFEGTSFCTSSSTDEERGLAYRWGVCAGAALKEEQQVLLTTEVITEKKKAVKSRGEMPSIDFVVTGNNLSIGLSVVKDRWDDAMLKKLVVKKIGVKDGVCKGLHASSYLFHFVSYGTLKDAVEQVQQFPVEKQSRVYTFVKDNNSLLCGTKVVRKSIVRSLASLPTHVSMPCPSAAKVNRKFSTLAFEAVRCLGRLL